MGIYITYKIYTGKVKIPNDFSDYFRDIGLILYGNIINNTSKSLAGGINIIYRNGATIFLHPVDEQEVPLYIFRYKNWEITIHYKLQNK